jgi:hypothetical protein
MLEIALASAEVSPPGTIRAPSRKKKLLMPLDTRATWRQVESQAGIPGAGTPVADAEAPVADATARDAAAGDEELPTAPHARATAVGDVGENWSAAHLTHAASVNTGAEPLGRPARAEALVVDRPPAPLRLMAPFAAPNWPATKLAWPAGEKSATPSAALPER